MSQFRLTVFVFLFLEVSNIFQSCLNMSWLIFCKTISDIWWYFNKGHPPQNLPMKPQFDLACKPISKSSSNYKSHRGYRHLRFVKMVNNWSGASWWPLILSSKWCHLLLSQLCQKLVVSFWSVRNYSWIN